MSTFDDLMKIEGSEDVSGTSPSEEQSTEHVTTETPMGETPSTETSADTNLSATKESGDTTETQSSEEQSVYDFTSLGSQYTSLDAVKDDLSLVSTLKQEVSTLKESLGKASYPFADPEIARINALYSKLKDKGINLSVAQKLSPLSPDRLSSMSDVDILVLQEFADSEVDVDEAMLRRVIARSYKNVLPSEEDMEDMDDNDRKNLIDDVEMEAFRLKKDADVARAKLKEIISVDVPESKSADEILQAQKQAKDQLREQWKPVIPEMINKGLSEIPIPVGNWNDIYEKFEVDTVAREKLVQTTLEYAVDSGLDLTEKNFKALHSAVVNRYMLDNLPALFQKAVNKAKREAVEAKDLQTDNPSSVSREVREPGGKNVDAETENFNRLMS